MDVKQIESRINNLLKKKQELENSIKNDYRTYKLLKDRKEARIASIIELYCDLKEVLTKFKEREDG